MLFVVVVSFARAPVYANAIAYYSSISALPGNYPMADHGYAYQLSTTVFAVRETDGSSVVYRRAIRSGPFWQASGFFSETTFWSAVGNYDRDGDGYSDYHEMFVAFTSPDNGQVYPGCCQPPPDPDPDPDPDPPSGAVITVATIATPSYGPMIADAGLYLASIWSAAAGVWLAISIAKQSLVWFRRTL